MNLQRRIELAARLGDYMLSKEQEWQDAKDRASIENGWFTPEFIEPACRNIAENFLTKEILEVWTGSYSLAIENDLPKKVGIVMAGNIPLVGFHDFLSVFISGHHPIMKPSSKDETLIKHLVAKLIDWAPELESSLQFAPMLKGCDAYIATGSNNSAGYFEFYFKKYPNIIRKNKTSAALLTGNESKEELDALANDVFLYFGMGCRNVTKVFVPQEYDFIPLLNAFKKFNYLADHHKYKNNYDYNLAILLLNHNYYMSTDAILLTENDALFSPISQLNFSYYTDKEAVKRQLNTNPDLQALVGTGLIPFGKSQFPAITDYADGIDTLEFLRKL